MEFLTNAGDTQAEHLLDHYQFIVVPMVNPDGVARGNHKLDALGQDLGRCFGSGADPELQPQIYGIKQVFTQLKMSHREIKVLVDVHATARN